MLSVVRFWVSNLDLRKYSGAVRSLTVTKLWPLLLIALWAPALGGQNARAPAANPLIEARHLFKDGKFHDAVAAYKAVIEKQASAEAYSGLVQSLLKLDDVKAADEGSQKALAQFPDSALTHAARGDVYFRRGLIPEAEDEYKAGLKLDDKCARCWLGQGKTDAVYSRRSQAKSAIVRAHELDPDDGDALYEWAVRQPYPESVAALEKHLAEFRNDEETERHEREYKELVKALAGRRVWVPARDVERTEIKLEALTFGPSLIRRGYGVRVRLNDRATVTLLLDTGSSGVTITRKLAEKIGAGKLSDQSLEGVGKNGASKGYKAWVDKIVIGELEFHDCYIQATPHEIAEVDGTIGTDVFSRYLVTVDFQKARLRLAPLPPPEPGNPADEEFSRAFSFGHFLLVRTDVGKKASGLFVIDSGANMNTISPELARLVPDMRTLNVPVSGASGVVNSAFIADDATLRFARVQKSGERISTVDLHSVSKDLGVEISGQIGFSAMEEMKLLIDYRDGLLQFTAR